MNNNRTFQESQIGVVTFWKLLICANKAPLSIRMPGDATVVSFDQKSSKNSAIFGRFLVQNYHCAKSKGPNFDTRPAFYVGGYDVQNYGMSH